jgi:hypothetical protein
LSKSAPESGGNRPIILSLRQLGHVPSFKNQKRAILDRASGKMRTMTKKETAAWMKTATAHLVFQLLSGYATGAGGTVTAHSLRCLIASLPRDDAWQFIPQITITAIKVPKGEEGADITIIKLERQI